VSEDRERELRIQWLEKQMIKAEFDMEAERQRQRHADRQLLRQTIQIGLSIVGLVIAAFAAGHFIR
jgi:hypothetical protein